MTGAILAAVEIERETAALDEAETYAEVKARRRAERIAEKIAARSRISHLVAMAATTPKVPT